MWNIKNYAVELIYKNRNGLTDLEKEFMVTRGQGWRERIDWELGIDMYIPLYYLKLTADKDLLYSPGNC